MIDTFLFNNELALLEARLSYLYSSVNYFYIAEANIDHVGNEKPLVFSENQKLFKKFSDKIRLIQISSKQINSSSENVFSIQNKFTSKILSASRTLLGKAVYSDFPESILMYSDLDEIIDKRILKKINTKVVNFLEGQLYYYYYNYRCVTYPYTRLPWVTLLPTKLLRNSHTLTYYRNLLFELQARYLGHSLNLSTLSDEDKNKYFDRHVISKLESEFNATIIKSGCYHFSYLGGVDEIIRKLKSAGHTELINKELLNPEYLEKCISAGEDIYNRGLKFSLEAEEALVDPCLSQWLINFHRTSNS